MTTDPRLTRGAFVDVVTHVSEIVCVAPGSTLPVPSHPGSARRRRARAVIARTAKPHEGAHLDTVEPGL
jgi:hypothetical protein